MLVYDDVAQLATKYVEELQGIEEVSKNFEVSMLPHDEFEKEMVRITSRQAVVREGKRPEYGDSEIDHADIFLVDYYLLEASKGMFVNGELVSYLGRCFTSCGLILGLNQYGNNQFDLRLTGHPESYADLSIGSAQLRNRGLWAETSNDFRPWHWPILPLYLAAFNLKTKLVSENVAAPIFESLGIADLASNLPRSALEFVGGEPSKRSFAEFVTDSNRALQGRDREGKHDEESIGRIAAARLSKWVERQVLPGQDVLIDAPHVVSRFPSLLDGDPTSIENWNKTAAFKGHGDLGMHDDRIEEYRLKEEVWASRPVWLWNQVANMQDIPEVSEPWKGKEYDFVFCEDSSSFRAASDAKEFISEVDSSYRRRYIAKFEGVNYTPIVRLVERKVTSGEAE